MKKMIAVLMSLCMLLCAAVSFAEETAVTAVSWSDYEAKAAETEGQFANVAETGLKMFIPAEFKDTEIPEEAMQDGTFLLLKSDLEEKAIVNGQVLQVNIAAFKEMMVQKGSNCFDLTVNGLNMFEFSVTSEVTTTCFAVEGENDTVLVFTFSNADQAPYTELYRLMAASIQPAE